MVAILQRGVFIVVGFTSSYHIKKMQLTNYTNVPPFDLKSVTTEIVLSAWIGKPVAEHQYDLR